MDSLKYSASWRSSRTQQDQLPNPLLIQFSFHIGILQDRLDFRGK